VHRGISILWGEKKVVLRQTRGDRLPLCRIGALSESVQFLRSLGFRERA
jgi:hypothetical protein